MKYVVRIALAYVAVSLLTPAAQATVKPHSLFTEGAVLQQGIGIPVWGTADEGEQVTVTLGKQKASTVSKDGKWMVRLKPMRAGGPFTMTIAGSNTVEFTNVLVGEVWVASGQSNMQFALQSATKSTEVIASSADPMLRLFMVPRKAEIKPVADIEASWQECKPETVPGFSAVAYFFGRDLRKALDVPVGLINTSWGGTIAQAWTSREGLLSSTEFAAMAPDFSRKVDGPNISTVLYNGMIAPLQPYAIRGAIWYQGESNAYGAYQYRTLFPTMIRSWREGWGQGDFPFLFVQLAPFKKIVTEPQESDWAELREAQLLTSLNYPKTGMAVITDVGDPQDIHPKQKEPVGQRLALAARAIAYRQRIVYQGPLYKSLKTDGDKAILSFTSVGKGLEARGGELTGFTIAGEDRKFVNASAVIQGDKVIVSCPQVAKPVAVRYGWADCPVVNLWNKDGLPASPFRTDNFPMLTGSK